MFKNIIDKVNNIKTNINNNINDNKNNPKDYSYIKEFKKQKLEVRLQSCNKILTRYPERIPIIIDCKNNIEIDKNKYIVPRDLNIAQFLFILRKRVNINEEQSLFLICNNKLLINTDVIGTIYSKYKDEDSFLYIYISLENTFGN